MLTTLSDATIRPLAERLHRANQALARQYPGDTGRRQPVHTVYGGAHLFRADIAARLGAAALRTLEQYGPDPDSFAQAIGLDNRDELARPVHARVVDKLRREPVEDFRIDFEDGYGNRPDAEEDAHAVETAREMASGLAAGTLPPFVGIRIKPLTEDFRDRAIRTLDLFLTTLVARSGGMLPPNFVVTLPKPSAVEQVAVFADLLRELESGLRLAPGSLKLELMIETTPAVLDARGMSAIPDFLRAAGGRAVAMHFGTYDYTASCSITAEYQQMTHAACDFAKHVMQVTLAGTGVWLSDGATNVLPVPPHRREDGVGLLATEIETNRTAVHRAWRLHYTHVRHSLVNGYYQGWDLHPAQFPTRYAAVFGFFLEGLDAAAGRLRNFVEKAARATLAGDVFDDAATGQGLLNFFLRAVNCGAVTEEEAAERTGLTLAELRDRSFLKILQGRTRTVEG
jgi:citrate lyase beta subunit